MIRTASEILADIALSEKYSSSLHPEAIRSRALKRLARAHLDFYRERYFEYRDEGYSSQKARGRAQTAVRATWPNEYTELYEEESKK